jgi:hypothetical protein
MIYKMAIKWIGEGDLHLSHRKSWSGKDVLYADENSDLVCIPKAIFRDTRGVLVLQVGDPVTHEENITPYLPSQEDLIATDWEMV